MCAFHFDKYVRVARNTFTVHHNHLNKHFISLRSKFERSNTSERCTYSIILEMAFTSIIIWSTEFELWNVRNDNWISFLKAIFSSIEKYLLSIDRVKLCCLFLQNSCSCVFWNIKMTSIFLAHAKSCLTCIAATELQISFVRSDWMNAYFNSGWISIPCC